MINRPARALAFFACTVTLLLSAVTGDASIAADVPAQLPDPDGKPGDATKPVKVYILAGQSNMVGMGNLSGAKNVYTGVYLSSDPAVPDGPFQIYKVGNYKVSPLRVYLPDGTPTEKPVAEGLIEVPQHGVYQVHCGYGDTSYNTLELAGKTVYSRPAGREAVKQEVTLEPGKRYPFRISILQTGGTRFWLQKMDLLGNGDLEAVAKREGKFPWLVDGDGKWTVRNDVYFQEARLAKDGKGSLLSPISNNGKSIGPELGFGHVLGTFHDEQVLLIKTAQGNRALGFDFRPPSSGRNAPDNNFEALEYKLMVEGVRKTLDNIDKVVPGYKGQGYEVSGFVWFQGHKDSFTEDLIVEYEKNLVNLINDVRKEFKVPDLPAVVGSNGFGGHGMQDKFVRILKAQLAVGDPKQHPEYAGTVASVDTRDFWREVDESPKGEDYHYNRNAETYMLIGDALGRAMVGLLGGKAEPFPVAQRPKRAARQTTDPSDEQKAAGQEALRPIILDGVAASYVANPRYNKSLLEEATGARPQRANQFLRGSMYGLLNCYHAAGIDEYDWRRFGPDLDKVQWDYFSFDPPETLPVEKGNRYRKVTYSPGMENWISPDFDAAKAGWKKGLQPFGQLDGKLAALSETCTSPFCRCGETPKTLWEMETLLIRGTFELPALKEGHRYRIVLAGAAHVNSGEGYAIYVNGKLLAESTRGVAVRQGGQPRGGYVFKDVHDEFKGGKVTVAATSFLRYNHPRFGVQPPKGHISLWMEEQKIPPVLAGE